jgi:hypothetical protein
MAIWIPLDEGGLMRVVADTSQQDPKNLAPLFFLGLIVVTREDPCENMDSDRFSSAGPVNEIQ